ncbi:fimbrial protein [Salmonella enterica]|nr:fimbrial protein [Salmonella enterica subsp. enterica]ECE8570154.1 fimbrial protein [Salmonella enterica subsp. enterica serovar Adelaide]EED2912265.1 fimbrial protein [Salmonella enterica subsp. enterica serovar Anecho]EIU4633589.1 fimbrial protein [Salmonella enterica]ECF0061745.1 fimbrial protein [Salmonella enterica subsp. enterica serovar Adelaide]
MKKTLIALAVAASAVASGSAMAAWTPDFEGNGEVNLGGTLTPGAKSGVWEAQVGLGNQGLNGSIDKGSNSASINVSESIPVIGIRTKSNTAFVGQNGMAPEIDYKGAVALDTFEQSQTTLTLDVKNAAGEKIGTMTAPFYGVGVISWKGANGVGNAANAYSDGIGKFFFGGLPSNKAKVSPQSADLAKGLISDIADKFDAQGAVISDVDWVTGVDANSTYSGYYAGGIMKNSAIKIQLEQPAQSDAIEWKASLPITVSYK